MKKQSVLILWPQSFFWYFSLFMHSKSSPDDEESKDLLERKKINLRAMIEIFNSSPTVWFGLNALFIEGFMLQEKKVDLLLRLSHRWMQMLVNKIEIYFPSGPGPRFNPLMELFYLFSYCILYLRSTRKINFIANLRLETLFELSLLTLCLNYHN